MADDMMPIVDVVQAVDGLDRGRRAALISHLPAKEAKAAFAELFDDLAPKDQP